MSHDDLHWRSATELRDLYRRREVSPVEVTDAVLARLERVEPSVNAFVTVVADDARAAAKAAERELLATPAEELPALHGIPVTVKDLVRTAGVRTTFGSTLFADHVPDADDVDWARLKAAGAILVGKTTTPEFGMLGVTESRLTGVTNNPWDPATTAGGSSGGAAASVAAGVAPLAWGSDGGGSIRIPATCCGVVGLKPSAGRIPFPEAPFEAVGTSGPLTRTVADAALLLAVTAGPDPGDPSSLPAADPAGYLRAAVEGSLPGALTGVRIGLAPHFGTGPVAAGVWQVVQEAAALMAGELGAVVEPVDLHLPDPLDYFVDFWASRFAVGIDELRALPGWADDRMHPVMLEIAERGRRQSAVELSRTSLRTRAGIAAGFAAAFAGHDLLVTPTMPLAPFPHPGDAGGPAAVDGIAVREPALDFHRLTEPPSHAGLPAISVPCGFAGGLPVGLQLVAPWHRDDAVLAAAAAYEAATDWHHRHPPA